MLKMPHSFILLTILAYPSPFLVSISVTIYVSTPIKVMIKPGKSFTEKLLCLEFFTSACTKTDRDISSIYGKKQYITSLSLSYISSSSSSCVNTQCRSCHSTPAYLHALTPSSTNPTFL